MPYDIGDGAQPGILRVRYTGLVNEQAWRRALTECIERIRQRNEFGVLFDFRAADAPLSITEHYDYLETMAAATMLLGRRYAFLQAERDDELWRFIETVSLNRGLEAKAFDDEARANDWLGALARRATRGGDH
jgi:hypothetical protein